MSAMKQQLVLGTLVITVFLAGCKPETSAKLDSLPNGVSFSGKLDKVRYDAAQKALIVKGDLTMDDYNALLAMSGDYEYRKAVDRLLNGPIEKNLPIMDTCVCLLTLPFNNWQNR
jgi:hypothetical protein